MLDILNLERRWLKYKIKTYLPYVTASGIILLLLISFFILFTSDSSQSAKEIEQIPAPVMPNSIEVPQTLPISVSKNIPITTPSVQEVPSQVIIHKTVEPAAVSLKQNTSTIPTHISVPKKTIQLSSPKILQPVENTTPSAPMPANASSKEEKLLVINRNESKLDVDSLQQRFKETSNPNLGLFIARYHYDHGNFSEAYNYALKTNAVNSRIDESWIIFSKSLVKLGKTEQAKKTLEFYIPQSNSENAKTLLDSIEKGDFK